jgi:hypothetical protein
LLSEASALTDGSIVHWIKPARVVAKQEMELTAEITDADGRPAVLEPYMGMAGHLMIQREDGSVFVHLHPLGTISLAAQRALSGTAQPSAAHTTGSPNARLLFPYAFPRPGRYRVWLQVRRAGRVLTAAHDVEVVSSPR